MTEEERIGIEEGIFFDSREDAIRAVQNWTLDRLLEWDDELRPFVAQHLINSVSAFGVNPPGLWTDIIMNKEKYNDMRDDDMDEDEGNDEFPEDEEEYDPRPTEESEKEILESTT